MARLFIYLWSAKFRKKGVYKYVLILQRDRLSSNLLLNCPVVALYLMNWLTGVSLLPFFVGS